MQIIGLLGGVASGKSMVARELEKRGAMLLDADRTGHEVLRLREVVAAARDRWGERILGPDGQIDRKQLAAIVFAPAPDGPREREYLERLTHPIIKQLLQEQVVAACTPKAGSSLTGLAPERKHVPPVVVLDAPLIFEAGWNDMCDKFVYVDAPEEVRLARAKARGWTDADFAARQAVQESLDFKRAHADVIIDNSGSPEDTQAQVERLWHSLVV